MNRKRKTVSMVVAVFVIAFLLGISGEAKGVTGIIKGPSGNIFVVQDGKIKVGSFRFRGNRYYAHTTSKGVYPAGAVARSTYRIENKKFYRYKKNGARLVKSTRYIRLKQDGSVDYWVVPGLLPKMRYKTSEFRYQIYQNGRWTSVGMQCFPYGEIDWQK